MSGFLASIGYGQWVLEAIMIVPLLGALIVMMGPSGQAKKIALGFALVEFVLSLGLWWAFDQGTASMQFEVRHEWIPAWGIEYHLGIDGISLFMVLLTTFMMPLTILGSWNYIKEREGPFYALMLVLTTGMLGVFVALDMFLFYVFWEIMLIPMYFIIGVWGGARRIYATIKFFVFTFFGSLLMLVAIGAPAVLLSQVSLVVVLDESTISGIGDAQWYGALEDASQRQLQLVGASNGLDEEEDVDDLEEL